MKFTPWIIALLTVVISASGQPLGEVRGSVVDARGGEILASVEILLGSSARRTVTDSGGKFSITGVQPGDYVLSVSTVGYHLVKRAFHIDPAGTADLEIVLSPDTLRQTVSVEAKVDPFETSHADSPTALVLTGNDIKNLASVMADDPLRSVQSLPGVSSDNDFDARFSLRGADYSRIGLYVDGVLLHQPFHMIEGQGMTGTGSAFASELVDQMELHEGAFPARFGDRSAGVLDVTLRDGSHDGFNFRATASASEAGVVAEGRLGKHGSWLAVTRKSYLQYLLARTFPDATLIFGIEDAQTRLSYDLTPKNTVSLYLLESFSSLDRAKIGPTLGVDSIVSGGYHYTLGVVGWKYSPTGRLLIGNHFAWMREKYNDLNPNQAPMSGGYYGEWVWNGTATWMWNSSSPLEAGYSVRRMRDEGFTNQFNNNVATPRLVDRFHGTGLRQGGYVEQSWKAWSGRLHFTAGARWDHHSEDKVAAVSPSGSAALSVTRSTQLQLAWGQYVQYPAVSVLTSILGSRTLLPARTNQTTAGIEQRIGARTRFRAEFYNRADRDLQFQPTYEDRVLANENFFTPSLHPQYANSLRGYSRGVEVFLQHSTANGLTGWVSYAFDRTGMREGVTGDRWPSDMDQKHTLNIYGSYRLRPSVNLSARASYGSGMPIPGYLTQKDGLYYLSGSRNQLRLPYSRVDFRINKAWTHEKWKLTLYGEVVNLTNRSNHIYESFDGYSRANRRAYLTLDTMFPILPSVGMVFEK